MVMAEENRVTTLREAQPPMLHDVQARRRQLIRLLLLVFVLAIVGIVLFSYVSELFVDRPIDLLDIGVLRVSFAVLALAFGLYIWERERALSRLEHALIEERVLSTALSSRVRELTAISRAGRAVASTLSLGDVLHLILESARELLGATEGSVMLLDEERKNLHIAAAVGIDDAVRPVIPIGEGVAGWVAEFREPIIIRGEVDDPRFRRFVPKDRNVRSAMSAPLYARAEPVGVLNVSVSEGTREYNEHDLRALTVFADHAAIAIANARLFEREKEASAQLEALDTARREFLAVVTHDLKAPLTAILGYVRLLRGLDGRGSPEQTKDFLEVVEQQGARMLDMLEQLIVATSLEEGAPSLARQPLDLRSLVEQSVSAFRGVLQERPIRLGIPGDLPTVFGDASAVQHILTNLVENAVKYSPQGAEIAVEVEAVPDEVRVTVADGGPGIPWEVLPHVFDRYRRADAQAEGASVGLGLFIVRSLAEGHGGRVWAENGDRGGARVTFALPLRRDREGV
jgi:two-component system, OmpR family, sensor histidine kinase KdpD